MTTYRNPLGLHRLVYRHPFIRVGDQQSSYEVFGWKFMKKIDKLMKNF